ncbi:hypothetical protein, partial [Bartonella bovis]|uniref:hypothetical protein n=1 Tax=Bartonella bovis TaxID=155194 RepID=UPI00130497A0
REVTSATLTNVTITGTGGQGKGVIMESSQTVTMTGVNISGVKMGVEATAGTLMIKDGSIGFKGDYGVKVGREVTSATLTNVTIEGTGTGKGVIMEGTTLEMSGGSISNVEKAVLMKEGTVTMT